ncbi:MAG TPA: choice-of-anchor tandem repeat GloVer-containing protein [Candidatus Nitrosotalea sp.]|nr:choice-of-anchor tandem repeat GloVer-containing protein [Candidatus Nitrosotalea sp.]
MRLLIVIALCAAAGCAQHTISPLPVAPGIPLRHDAAPADSFKSLYSFKGNPDGQNPYAGLANLGGTLYGTTLYGGKNQFGVLFKVSTTGAERVLHTFGGGSQNDGAEPYGTMIVLNGSLYGTTYYGGRAPADHGAVFKASAAGTENIVCSFTSSQGEFPYTGVFALNGTLYGTTHQGGAHGYGSAYACTTAGKVRVLHSFALSPDGAYPYDPPAALKGTLYGTTYQGGTKDNTYGYGIVYSVTTAGAEHVLHKFTGYPNDGAYPRAGLLAVGGALYGTTAGGGASNNGTVYKISSSGSEQVIYSFKGGSDGVGPSAGLIAVTGTLYGTTSSGGAYGQGTVFKVTTSGNEAVLHSFSGVAPDGSDPIGGLVNLNGELYGTTYYGGSHGDGIVFKIAP